MLVANLVGSIENDGAWNVKEDESKLGLYVAGCAVIGQGDAVKMFMLASVTDIRG